MATENIAPDSLIASTGFSSCANSDLTSVDANFCVATDNNTDTETHNSFPTPTGDPVTGAGLQEHKCEVRRTSGSGTGTATARIEVFEAGVQRVVGSETDVTSDTSQTISLTWDATVLSDSTGAGVEIKVFGTRAGGGPSARSAVDVGFVEWVADVAGATQDISPATIAATGAVFTPLLSIDITPATIVATGVVFAPTITTGAVDISPNTIASTGQVFSPTVTLSGGTQDISPGVIVATGTVFSPLLTIDITPPLITATGQVFSPVLTVGAVNIDVPLIASSGQVFSPVVTQPLPKAIQIDFLDEVVINTNLGKKTLYFNGKNYFTI